MLEFRIGNVVPPGGRYFYTVAETRTYLEALTYTALEEQVAAHLRANGLPIPENLTAAVQHYMCERLPAGFCRGTPDGVAPKRVYSIAEIRERTRRMVAGREMVDAGTARSRAHTCANCGNNDRSVCPTCVGLTQWAVKTVGGRSTGLEQVLGICTADACLIPAKIYVKVLETSVEGHSDSCWRKHE